MPCIMKFLENLVWALVVGFGLLVLTALVVFFLLVLFSPVVQLAK